MIAAAHCLRTKKTIVSAKLSTQMMTIRQKIVSLLQHCAYLSFDLPLLPDGGWVPDLLVACKVTDTDGKDATDAGFLPTEGVWRMLL